MEEKEVKSEEEKNDVKNENPRKKRFKFKGFLLVLLLAVIIFLGVIFVIPSRDGDIQLKVKSTLEKVVEKSNLETININYNVIAKKCKDEDKCNLKSNNIKDFEYVASCKGIITAGIDFSDVKITVDYEKKKVIITLPAAKIIDEPNITSIKFLNGSDLPANEFPNARKLCQETTLEKSREDEKLLPAAKEQAIVVLGQFYKQWIKAFDDSYQVEIK